MTPEAPDASLEADAQTALDQVLGAPVDARQPILRGLDPHLRGRVEELLAQIESTSVLDGDAADQLPGLLAEVSGDAEEPKTAFVGRRLGPYRLTEPIGQGGMGRGVPGPESRRSLRTGGGRQGPALGPRRRPRQGPLRAGTPVARRPEPSADSETSGRRGDGRGSALPGHRTGRGRPADRRVLRTAGARTGGSACRRVGRPSFRPAASPMQTRSSLMRSPAHLPISSLWDHPRGDDPAPPRQECAA